MKLTVKLKILIIFVLATAELDETVSGFLKFYAVIYIYVEFIGIMVLNNIFLVLNINKRNNNKKNHVGFLQRNVIVY